MSGPMLPHLDAAASRRHKWLIAGVAVLAIVVLVAVLGYQDFQYVQPVFIDKDGTPTPPPVYTLGPEFVEGLRRTFNNRNAGETFARIEGRLVEGGRVDAAFLRIQEDIFNADFTNPPFPWLVGDSLCYIDETGAVVFEVPEAVQGNFFHDGLAAVAVQREENETGYTPVSWGYVDRDGNFAIAPQFASAADFSQGLACVEKEDKHGFIDKQGEFIIPPRFVRAWPFSEGIAAVAETDGEWGFIDDTGAYVIEPAYYHAGTFSEGLAPVYVRTGSDSEGAVQARAGYIDPQGAEVISPRFAAAEPFSNGVAAAADAESQRYGYIDKQGQWVIPPRFLVGGQFTEGKAQVVRMPRTVLRILIALEDWFR
ncbi:MAG: WG repeat-containing protein [Candidatus Hydrogenedentota bacterium]